jgi:hypothetical protein
MRVVAYVYTISDKELITPSETYLFYNPTLLFNLIKNENK